MKKVVLILLVALGLLNQKSSAQSFTVAHDTAFAWAGNLVNVYQYLTNTTTGSLIVSWKVHQYSLAPGWTVDGICDNAQCQPSSVLTDNLTYDGAPYNPGTDMDMHVMFLTNSAPIASTSWVTLKVWDKNAPINSKYITFMATKAPLGVSTVVKSDDNVILYPNPAKSDVNVIFDQSSGAKNIAIYNIIGKAVSVYRVNGNSAKMNVDNLPSGIYFVRLLDGQGRIIATRKFTHQ